MSFDHLTLIRSLCMHDSRYQWRKIVHLIWRVVFQTAKKGTFTRTLKRDKTGTWRFKTLEIKLQRATALSFPRSVKPFRTFMCM